VATTPLFNASTAILVKRLRLTGVAAGRAAEALILEGMLRARLAFYRRLGAARVAALVAVAYEENPDSADEVIRALANTVEVKLVHVHLLDTMPTMFMDGSGKSQEIWNEEAPFRQGQTPESTKVRLREEIEADMAVLALETELGDEGNWQITNNEPEEDPPFPGDTAFGEDPGFFSAPTESGD
jgi:hypothetical protein